MQTQNAVTRNFLVVRDFWITLKWLLWLMQCALLLYGTIPLFILNFEGTALLINIISMHTSLYWKWEMYRLFLLVTFSFSLSFWTCSFIFRYWYIVICVPCSFLLFLPTTPQYLSRWCLWYFNGHSLCRIIGISTSIFGFLVQLIFGRIRALPCVCPWIWNKYSTRAFLLINIFYVRNYDLVNFDNLNSTSIQGKYTSWVFKIRLQDENSIWDNLQIMHHWNILKLTHLL